MFDSAIGTVPIHPGATVKMTTIFQIETLRRLAWPTTIVILTILILLIWRLYAPLPQGPSHPISGGVNSPPAPSVSQWHQGAANARFTLILYADLECPYCKDYYPELTHWVAQQHDIRLQWHHLILSSHEPAASHLASMAECAGKSGGHDAYWQMITWIYQHTRGNGEGLPPNTTPPGLNQAMRSCMDSEWPHSLIRRQVEQAHQEGVQATPSLRLIDQQTNRAMLLTGPVQGDALLSALDLLSAPQTSDEEPKLPADITGHTPR
ncbi:thioredoxin domain-containing protein [Pectobacterium aroidearum]|uniref:DsbA family protein n=1 Tax=Pectobacterium aroidearum TaxID=1201031 RepID=UPI003158073B